MKYILGILVVLIAGSAIAADPATDCDKDSCDIQNNCRCSNQDSPISHDDLDSYPQLISITVDDSVTDRVYNEFIDKLLLDPNRVNPDNAAISATFFVPHEYTNYKLVNDLYNFGFEIGVHSISNDPHQEYWRTATEDLLVQEFQGQKHIISKFANIPEDAIIGGRTPELQLSGDRSMSAYITANLQYDSTWPSLSGHRMFPYTLDYKSTQECLLGAECPTGAFKGFWVLPINNLKGSDRECNTLANCDIKGSAEEIGNWLTDQIEQVRKSTKTPMTLMVSSGWFNYTQNSFGGFQKFMDNMKEKNDVFFVSQKQVLEFVKNPVKTAEFKTDDAPEQASCDSRTCKLKKNDEDRNMVSCTACPQVYPWVGNPDGNPTNK